MLQAMNFQASSANLGKYARLEPETVDEMRTQVTKRIAQLKPVSEFFDLKRFQKPSNYSEFKSNLDFNLVYFANNYLLSALVLVGYFLITNLFLLLAVLFSAGGFKFIQSQNGNPLKLSSGVIVTTAQMWIGYGVVVFVLFFFTGVTTSLLWAVFCIGSLIALHAGCIQKPIEAEFGDQDMINQV